jgi:hypothetical protein
MTRDAEKNARRLCSLSLSVPSLGHSAFPELPSAGSAEPASTVSSLDLGTPFRSAGAHPAVQAVDAGYGLGEGGGTD